MMVIIITMLTSHPSCIFDLGNENLWKYQQNRSGSDTGNNLVARCSIQLPDRNHAASNPDMDLILKN